MRMISGYMSLFINYMLISSLLSCNYVAILLQVCWQHDLTIAALENNTRASLPCFKICLIFNILIQHPGPQNPELNIGVNTILAGMLKVKMIREIILVS